VTGTRFDRMRDRLESSRVSAEVAEDAGRKLLVLLDERKARREAIARMVRQGGEG
jgi:propanediol dehydratase small subunit